MVELVLLRRAASATTRKLAMATFCWSRIDGVGGSGAGFGLAALPLLHVGALVLQGWLLAGCSL